jgi:hypothetical protein
VQADSKRHSQEEVFGKMTSSRNASESYRSAAIEKKKLEIQKKLEENLKLMQQTRRLNEFQKKLVNSSHLSPVVQSPIEMDKKRGF